MAIGQPTTSKRLATMRKSSWGRWLGIGALTLFGALLLSSMVPEIVANPALLVQQLWIGLINGAIIAIIALGYTMVYGIIELINFAHADVFMLGAFFTLILLALMGITKSTAGYLLYPALIVIFVTVSAACAGINVTIERFTYRKLRNAPRLAPLISAIGVSFILQNVGLWLGGRDVYLGDRWSIVGIIAGLLTFAGTWQLARRFRERQRWVWSLGTVASIGVFLGVRQLLQGLFPFKLGANVMGNSAAGPKSVPNVLPSANLLAPAGGTSLINISIRDIIIVMLAFGLMIGLYLFVKNTRLGKAMRATAQDRDAARLMGINVDQTIMLTFLIGGALAGAAGVIFALFYGTVVFTLGFTQGLRAFTSAVLGGIGNIVGAMLGGLLIGFLSALSDTYLATSWTNALVFSILVIILVFRPSGLLGEDVQQKA